MRECYRCKQVKKSNDFFKSTSLKFDWICKLCKTRENKLARFKITLDDEIALLEKQDNRCAICKSPFDKNKKRPCIDHDHNCCQGQDTCGRCIRGILCFSCNTGLGMFYDNPHLLLQAAEYLKNSGVGTTLVNSDLYLELVEGLTYDFSI